MDAALTAVEMIQCSHVVALQFQIARLKHKMPLESEGVYRPPSRSHVKQAGQSEKESQPPV